MNVLLTEGHARPLKLTKQMSKTKTKIQKIRKIGLNYWPAVNNFFNIGIGQAYHTLFEYSHGCEVMVTNIF